MQFNERFLFVAVKIAEFVSASHFLRPKKSLTMQFVGWTQIPEPQKLKFIQFREHLLMTSSETEHFEIVLKPAPPFICPPSPCSPDRLLPFGLFPSLRPVPHIPVTLSISSPSSSLNPPFPLLPPPLPPDPCLVPLVSTSPNSTPSPLTAPMMTSLMDKPFFCF